MCFTDPEKPPALRTSQIKLLADRQRRIFTTVTLEDEVVKRTFHAQYHKTWDSKGDGRLFPGYQPDPDTAVPPLLTGTIRLAKHKIYVGSSDERIGDYLEVAGRDVTYKGRKIKFKEKGGFTMHTKMKFADEDGREFAQLIMAQTSQGVRPAGDLLWMREVQDPQLVQVIYYIASHFVLTTFCKDQESIALMRYAVRLGLD